MVDIVTSFIGFIGRSVRIDSSHKKKLGTYFRDIADLLEGIKDELNDGCVPRQSSYRLAALINATTESLHGVFRISNEDEINDIFTKRLPRIGYLLRAVDVFLDGKPRKGAHKYMYALRARDEDYAVSPQSVMSATEEIDRAIGQLRGAADFLDPKREAGKGRSKKPSNPKIARKKKTVAQKNASN
jgi:hypothetical protein